MVDPGLVVVDKAAGHDVARRRRPGTPAGRHPQGRPRRHARPDGDRRARARRQPRHPAARAPDADREGVRRHDPARRVDDHRRRRGRGHRDHAADGLTDEAIRDAPSARSSARSTQVPTAVSAIKVDGKRAYQRVRDGEEVELKARPVTDPRARRAPTVRGAGGSTSTSPCAARAAPTSARSPATSAPRWASAGTSPRCGVRRSAASTSPRARTLEELADDLDAGRRSPTPPGRRFPAVDLDEDAGGRRPRRAAARPGPARRRRARACSRPTASSWRSTSRAASGPGRSPSSSEREVPAPSWRLLRRADLALLRRRARPTSAAPSSRSATSTACTSATSTCCGGPARRPTRLGVRRVVAVTFDPHPMAVLGPSTRRRR